jgi:integrase
VQTFGYKKGSDLNAYHNPVFSLLQRAWLGKKYYFRWHDLRHTWASWHVQNGTPLHILQKPGGWSEIRMVQRYAHLAPEHLAGYAGNISGLKGVSGTLIGYT